MFPRFLVACLALLLAGCDSCTRPETTPPDATGGAPISHEQIPPDGVSGAGAAAAPAAARLAAEELTWAYPQSAAGPMQVVVVLPARAPDQRFPVLVVLHGLGEARKGPERGARGWIDDYWMVRAIDRLHHPPLGNQDLLGLSDPARLAAMNADLAQQPYRDLIVVCPYTPDISSKNQPFSAAEPLTRFVVDELLPRVMRDTPALGTVRSTGIDGVSLGGRAALLVGLSRPEAFGTVAAQQPAFSSADAPALTELATRARTTNPDLRIRLLTSLEDFYLVATRTISQSLDRAAVAHQLDVIAGPHSYDFNRGPGVYELLLFHDRALRGEPTR